MSSGVSWCSLSHSAALPTALSFSILAGKKRRSKPPRDMARNGVPQRPHEIRRSPSRAERGPAQRGHEMERRVARRVGGSTGAPTCLLYTSDAADDLTRVDLG